MKRALPDNLYPYSQCGKQVAYRYQKKINGQIDQKYFFYREYGGELQAYRAAMRHARERAQHYAQIDLLRSVFSPNGKLAGLMLYREYRLKYTEPRLVLRLQITRRGKKYNRDWNLRLWNWEAAFEDAVRAILQIRQISLTTDIALRIERAKTFYDPTRKTNWIRK